MVKLQHAFALGAVVALLNSCGSDWSTIKQPRSGFVVDLPGEANCASNRESTSKGQLTGHSCVAQLSRSLLVQTSPAWFVVSWAELPPNVAPNDVEALCRELATRGLSPELESKKRSELLGGVQGVEFETSEASGDPAYERLVVRGRFVVHLGRLYWIEAHGAMSQAAEKAWDRINETFHFVDGEKPV
jgi:hypothetical protein